MIPSLSVPPRRLSQQTPSNSFDRSVPRQPPSHGEPRNTGATALIQSSPPKSFSEVVNAPYAAAPLPPPSPKSWIRRPPTASSSQAQVDVSVEPVPEEDESDEEEMVHDSSVPRDAQWRPAYVPEPRWAWAGDQPLSRTQMLLHLASTPMCKTDLIRGLIGQRSFTLIRRNWSRASASQTGLYKELKLFSSERYLRPLQGVVVPYLINVYDDVDTVALIMEPPHHTFWLEASPELPNVLKKRIVDAYIKLHHQGVLHGSVETHNILVNAEGRVTLVDFSEARATRPVPELGLDYADRKELELELRKVMFIINYEGSWKREQAKMKRVTEQAVRNEERRELRALKARGEYDGPITPDELPTPEDHAEPPPHPVDWNNWCASLGKPLKRFIVPGQPSAQVGITIRDFYVLVKRLERQHVKEMTSPLLASGSLFLLPVPYTPFVSSILNNRKRKASEDLGSEDEQHLAKRVHDMLTPPQSTSAGPRYIYSSKSYSTGTSDTLLAAPSGPTATTDSKSTPAVKVRDFADVPYDGPRGYYFPFPPNEYIMASHRIAYIRNSNAIECGRLGLPYYRGDINMLRPPSYRRPLPKGMHISLGGLKRKREAGEGKAPVTREEQRAAKRQRFLEEREVSLKEERPIRFNDDVAYVDMPLFEEHGDVRLSAPFSSPRHHRGGRRPHSILKATRPVKTISYDLRLWPIEGATGAAISVKEPLSVMPSSRESPPRSSTSRPESVTGIMKAAGPGDLAMPRGPTLQAHVLAYRGASLTHQMADVSSGSAVARMQVAPPGVRSVGNAVSMAMAMATSMQPPRPKTEAPRRTEVLHLSLDELEEVEVEETLESEVAAGLAVGEEEEPEDHMLMDIYAWLSMRPSSEGYRL